ncbi:cytochrome d ubiquinol oxidase subunit II [Hydrogenophaga sp.]|jgi:cytochrome d ubiquinol oxidase subunit II|uniref:cytochrome d ubiquinol oxidase subunit II n=1 Tax=Hydrogenophaga sp. TaxID=1904254 RepID=UPI0015F4968A|nr:cytochrome d ubiquinol oxidase subunit II [Hydrogenophaga sp.]MBI2746342.1 cytochrome d ubiquinol oxidase subunit II [Burkholderiales bacterium]MDO9201977.1 cytochrome d ubiquinol oxidase subunit II [Hydrogenophaga sp.]MDP3627878.1 cytochrome d ubiquinol oxidase subunit II [Hydrogenophaga sp.]MDZ4101319.1 cytochrome d ubiquinol oxidase subunit II [Hydrogenophaga sp.]MDZ4281543.1 cytochrome d ubiquinol oxidase subunit II [Hydrogenophaga sp.]
MSFDQALPLIFLALMGLSMLVYVLSDGYDLGVGMLLPRATDAEKDIMVASIGPFWDANETWIVLGVGMLLIAFPKAHGLILTELYLPVTLMLVGLVLRGVAFDFRVKAHDSHKAAWNRLFFGGSLLASMMQGWMLGRYISGFGEGWNYPLFAAAIALTLPAAYVLLGAAWLVMKTEGDLQAKAVGWAQQAWWPVVLGMVLISMATPWISTTVRERWFALPQIIALLVIPATTAGALLVLRRVLPTRLVRGELCWLPFVLLIAVFVLGFVGLAYSIYPYVVIDKLTMWQAASSPATLKVTLVGVCISVPAIVAYTIYSYRVFGGKATELRYG